MLIGHSRGITINSKEQNAPVKHVALTDKSGV